MVNTAVINYDVIHVPIFKDYNPYQPHLILLSTITLLYRPQNPLPILACDRMPHPEFHINHILGGITETRQLIWKFVMSAMAIFSIRRLIGL